jgi:hypothetical protein
MNFALRLRPTMLLALVVTALTLFATAGQAAAAQRPHARLHRTTAAHPRGVAKRHPVAYADGTLTIARQSHRRVLAHADTAIARGPVAYADGTLTAARRQHHSRTRRHRVVRRRAV